MFDDFFRFYFYLIFTEKNVIFRWNWKIAFFWLISKIKFNSIKNLGAILGYCKECLVIFSDFIFTQFLHQKIFNFQWN